MIPKALPVLQQRFPRLSIAILQGDSRDILTKIQREEAEIGIVGSRFTDDAIVYSPLGCDRLVLIVGKEHPWFDRPAVDLDELQEQHFITREQGSGTWKTVHETLTAVGLDPARLDMRISLGSNEAIKHAVAGGTGISFVSEHSVRLEIELHELSEVKIPGLDISRSFYLASQTGRELSPAAAAFADVMTEMYG
jgi:DNA-binding transcriptional LysR family regulator